MAGTDNGALIVATTDLELAGATSIPIYRARGVAVVLDSDLAKLYGVETKRLNEQVKRNADRFAGGFAFQLASGELEALKSQIATPNGGRGGRRSVPWVFTEHGVVMAASVVNSERAIKAMRLVVEVFIDVKNRVLAGSGEPAGLVQSTDVLVPGAETGLARLGGAWDSLGPKLRIALEQVLDTVVDQRNQTTIRETAQDVISESIQNMKERLAKPGLENAELAAKAAKLLAEAQERKSVAAKTHAEADSIEFSTIVKKLRLLLEAERAIRSDTPDAFLDVLREMGSG
jgi:hypothetical protein